MSTHTPGPWTWYWQRDRDGYADGRIGTDPKSNTLGMSACVAVSPRLVDQPQWEADARLIAAAPDMLAELKEIVSWARDENAALRKQEIDHIKAVIAKAEGLT